MFQTLHIITIYRIIQRTQQSHMSLREESFSWIRLKMNTGRISNCYLESYSFWAWVSFIACECSHPVCHWSFHIYFCDLTMLQLMQNSLMQHWRCYIAADCRCYITFQMWVEMCYLIIWYRTFILVLSEAVQWQVDLSRTWGSRTLFTSHPKRLTFITAQSLREHLDLIMTHD